MSYNDIVGLSATVIFLVFMAGLSIYLEIKYQYRNDVRKNMVSDAGSPPPARPTPPAPPPAPPRRPNDF